MIHKEASIANILLPDGSSLYKQPYYVMEKALIKMIFGFVIMLMFSVLIVADEAWFLILGVAGGGWLYHSGLTTIIRLEQASRKQRIDEISALPSEDQITLTFDRKAWIAYAEIETKHTKNIPLYSTAVAFALIGLGSGLAILNSDADALAFLIFLTIVTPICYATWSYMKDQTDATLQAFFPNEHPQIVISRQGIVVNKSIILKLGNEQVLQGFESEEKEGLTQLKIISYFYVGGSKKESYYFFPMPTNIYDIALLNKHFQSEAN